MPRGDSAFSSPPWFKLHSGGWLRGSMRFELTAEERSVWADFLALANESRTRGVIQANGQVAYPHAWLASTLNIPVELLEQCIVKFEDQDRIHENSRGIEILNFAHYQGSIERKPGRPSKRPVDPDKYTSGKYGHMVNR